MSDPIETWKMCGCQGGDLFQYGTICFWLHLNRNTMQYEVTDRDRNPNSRIIEVFRNYAAAMKWCGEEARRMVRDRERAFANELGVDK